MILTKELIEKGKSRNGGYNGEQMKLLGYKSGDPKGWLKAKRGTYISDEDYQKFIGLKDTHLKPSN